MRQKMRRKLEPVMKRKLLAYMGLLIFAGLLVAAVIARNLPEWPSQAVTKGR